MSRRSIATVKRPNLHRFDPPADDPLACRCGLPERNSVHDQEALAARAAELAEQQAEHRRRLGES